MPDMLGSRVDATSYEAATDAIIAWAKAGQARKVAACTVHMLIEAWDDPMFRQRLRTFDLVTPDGMPLVWRLRQLGNSVQNRVYGPDLMLYLCAAAEREDLPIGIFGGLPDALQSTVAALGRRYPRLRIAYTHSPPFKPVTVEDESSLEAIRSSGAKIMFVALGCPKQEHWAFLNAPELGMPVIAVGAAIDFIGGKVAQAPSWVQRCGLEWAFRMLAEPRRLVKRYAYINTKFIGLWLLGRL